MHRCDLGHSCEVRHRDEPTVEAIAFVQDIHAAGSESFCIHNKITVKYTLISNYSVVHDTKPADTDKIKPDHQDLTPSSSALASLHLRNRLRFS